MISVIIPTYNRGYIVKSAIESILNQSYKNIELIIVDDGSTDNTQEVVNSIKDERIKYIRYDNNKGACYARNIGIKASQGEYITFHDSDDYCYKDRIKLQYENIQKNDADIDFCNFDIYCEDKFLHHSLDNKMEKLIKKHGYYQAVCYRNFVGTPTILVKKEILSKYLFDENLARFQDYDLILRIFANQKISHTNKVLLRQNVQKNSITKNNEKGLEALNIMINKNSNNNLLKSTLYIMCANMYSSEHKKEIRDCYKKSLKCKFRLKVFIKLILHIYSLKH